MTNATVPIRKWGNSLGIVIPKDVVKEIDVSEGDFVDVSIVKKRKISGFGLCKQASPFVEDEEEHPDIS
jgi:antitoxin component of MazEF toxin-antitoxin module